MRGTSRLRIGATAALAALALGFAACGGDESEEGSEEPTGFTSDVVLAAFEQAAGDYPFQETRTLVEGATAYAPVNSTDPVEIASLTDGLGESSIVWQVLVFDGEDPPLDGDAAEAAAFSSETFEEIEPGVYLGDNDIAYVGHGNVVINGPVLDGAEDETLAGWKAVLDGL